MILESSRRRESIALPIGRLPGGGGGGGGGTFVRQLDVQDSPIVCFESRPDDEHGAHSAVETSHGCGGFPPNTLFRLKEVKAAGTWEAPGGCRPQQRLLVVTATYQPPREGYVPRDSGGSKMCGSAVTLSYKTRDAFLKGLDDLIAKPALTMKDEFTRPDSWTDWRGVSYTSTAEWEYVNGLAQKQEGCTPGTRDADNNGKTPKKFLDNINRFIEERRSQGHGTMLHKDHAHLTLDEVLAVRLCTPRRAHGRSCSLSNRRPLGWQRRPLTRRRSRGRPGRAVRASRPRASSPPAGPRPRPPTPPAAAAAAPPAPPSAAAPAPAPAPAPVPAPARAASLKLTAHSHGSGSGSLSPLCHSSRLVYCVLRFVCSGSLGFRSRNG